MRICESEYPNDGPLAGARRLVAPCHEPVVVEAHRQAGRYEWDDAAGWVWVPNPGHSPPADVSGSTGPREERPRVTARVERVLELLRDADAAGLAVTEAAEAVFGSDDRKAHAGASYALHLLLKRGFAFREPGADLPNGTGRRADRYFIREEWR